MYRSSHDSWERLVEAVLRREQLRETALDYSCSPSPISSVSTSPYRSSDINYDVMMMNDMKGNGSRQPNNETEIKIEGQREDHFEKFILFEGRNREFDIRDLLSASAETLGKGAFWFTYSAQIRTGQTVVVKILKKGNVSKLEFEKQIKFLGSIKHENVVTPRGYGYHSSKYHKFILYDHYSQGSVSTILHGNKRGLKKFLDWKSRQRIAIGVARGIAHIHTVCGGTFIHGNIKASNVFLNSQEYGCISELGLAKLLSPTAPPYIWTAGYAATEVMYTGTVSQASDVYSFGVLLLELVTGLSPIHCRTNNRDVDFVRWVYNMIWEGLEVVVFDALIYSYFHLKELEEILEIAMSCVEEDPDCRPKMSDVVKMIEKVVKFDEDSENFAMPESFSSEFEDSENFETPESLSDFEDSENFAKFDEDSENFAMPESFSSDFEDSENFETPESLSDLEDSENFAKPESFSSDFENMETFAAQESFPSDFEDFF